jgi:SWI/SNF-related matrix-associated actin-dependent regulator of chromatin subfamily A member 5
MKKCTENAALQGERETNELNNKLAQFSENAMKFTMDGGLSAYDYKAEEEEAGEDVNFKALAGARSSLVTDGPINQ